MLSPSAMWKLKMRFFWNCQKMMSLLRRVDERPQTCAELFYLSQTDSMNIEKWWFLGYNFLLFWCFALTQNWPLKISKVNSARKTARAIYSHHCKGLITQFWVWLLIVLVSHMSRTQTWNPNFLKNHRKIMIFTKISNLDFKTFRKIFFQKK